jgi:predicted amidohydrolase YtcJ
VQEFTDLTVGLGLGRGQGNDAPIAGQGFYAEHDAALRYAVNMLSAYGITGIQDAWIRDEEELRTYQRLQEEGELNVRVVASLYWEPSKGLKQLDAMKILREQFSKDLFQVTTVKIKQDGVMENYTAVLTEPYLLEEETLVYPC